MKNYPGNKFSSFFNFNPKSLFLILSLLLFSVNSHSQDLDVVITVATYSGGTNLTCHGAHDGSMEAVIVGGTAPYSYQWNSGSYTAYTKSISNLGPGEYFFTVIDGNNDTIQKSGKIFNVDVMTANPELSHFEGGYNVSYQGGDDGYIHTNPSGGTSPYTFLWNTNIQEENIGQLTAGSYTVTITDANQCVLTMSVSLTEPTPLHITSITSPLHHGYNISCEGIGDGLINLSVAGGVPPYTYLWNTGDTTQNLDSLKGGTYTVQIRDANDILITRSIFLSQPKALTLDLTPYIYSNGKNTSCFTCADGAITSTVADGVSPYTYVWSSGQTSPNISGVIAKNYQLQVTDINGCVTNKEINLTQPDRDDWTVKGNVGTNPSIHYIGSSDSTAFTIRTNNIERMRINSNGNVTISKGLSLDSLNVSNNFCLGGRFALGHQNASGSYPEIFSYGQTPSISPYGIASCIAPALNSLPNHQFHGTIQLYGNSAAGGNLNILEMGFDGINSIIDATGNSTDPNANRLLINHYCGKDVFICGSGGRIKLGGTNTIVGVGIDPTTVNQNGDYRLFVADGIRTEKVKVDVRSNWPDFVFKDTYKQMSISELSQFIKHNGHLPGIDTEAEISRTGIDIGEYQIKLLQKIEELSLYIIELNSKYEKLNEQMNKGKISK